jgi:iron(III) transport system permease protein
MRSSANSLNLSRPLQSLGRARRSRYSGGNGLHAIRATLWIICLVVFAAPLGAILVVGASGASLSVLLHDDIVQATVNSVVSAGISGLAAVAFGTILAILLDRTDLPGRSALRLVFLSPFLVPPFVGAIAWIGVAGPQSIINQFWTSLFGAPLWNIYGGDGVTFLLFVHSYPIAYLIVGAALRRVPSDLEQAARTSGARPWQTALHITIPLVFPAMVSSFTLIAIANLADFGIPAIVGLPERFATLSTIVYRYLESGTVDDPLAVVATIGIVLLILATVGAAVSILTSRRIRSMEPSATPPSRLELGRARWPLGLAAWILALALTALPLLALAVQAFLRAPGVPLTIQNLTFANFTTAVTAPTTVAGATNSVLLSLAAGLICGLLGLVIGTLTTRTRFRGGTALRILSILPQGIPGLIIAVGWLLIAPTLGLFNTPWLILCAYVMAFTALVVQSVAAPLSAIPSSLEEAARSAGASRMRALTDISLRLGVPAAITGAILVVLTAARELTISVLLVAPGTQTLGVAIFNLQQSGAYSAASSLSLIITIIGLAGLGLAARQLRN